MPEEIKVAVAGNPNCGKTTVFNAITGARQNVANYPGATVEIKEGLASVAGLKMHVVDLPGTYSLAAYSAEEIVARDFILTQKPRVVIDVVDASNLERNLYLAVQLMELGAPLVISLNMIDVAESRGMHIDFEHLSKLLGVTLVPTVANRRTGIDSLLAAVVAVSSAPPPPPALINYGRDVNSQLDELTRVLETDRDRFPDYPLRWLAARLLENDDEVVRLAAEKASNPLALMAQVEKARSHIRTLTGADAETVIADRRYGFISGACQESVRSDVEARHVFSDKVDVVATHHVLGIPILLALMYAVFYLTFNVASYPASWIESARIHLGDLLRAVLPASSAHGLTLQSLVVDGILGGVGSVVVFLPNVMVLFLAIAALEDSGYMARAAFVMDHLMHKIGLHGKSFIPMLLGFGCTVPAVMSTRIIENRRDRLATMLVLPLMSCSGKYPVYALLVPAFFPLKWQGPVLWLIYVLGIVMAVLFVKLLKSSLLKGESHPLVMELPPYRMPTVKGLLIHTWERSWLFIRKAGTVILAAAVIIWFFTNWPAPDPPSAASATPAEAQQLALRSSLVGRVGTAMEPALSAIGFDWRVGTALVGASIAKEVFIAQMGIAYGLSGEREEPLADRLQRDYSPLSGFCMLLFTLIASPCIATVAVVRRESGSWRWAAFQWFALTVLAYLVALVVYQAGNLLGIGV